MEQTALSSVTGPASLPQPAPVRRDHGLFVPITVAWQYRDLILAVLRQDLAARFRGSLFGWGWAIVGPLVTLALYTIAFSSALRLPVAKVHGGIANYALWVFAGLIVFNLFAELSYRAPFLLHEHAARIKTSIFPCETLAWVAVLRSFVYAGISLGVMLVFEIFLTGRIPLSLLLLPLLVVPLGMLLLGLVWFLAAVGAFARDIAHLMITIVPVAMIISPVFYSIADLPETLRIVNYLNPLTPAIEIARAMVLTGDWPALGAFMWLALVSLGVFRGGYVFFIRYKGILVDVI